MHLQTHSTLQSEGTLRFLLEMTALGFPSSVSHLPDKSMDVLRQDPHLFTITCQLCLLNPKHKAWQMYGVAVVGTLNVNKNQASPCIHPGAYSDE